MDKQPIKKEDEKWSTEEKKLLRELISRLVNENKGAQAPYNISKEEWENIAKKINEVMGKNRSDGEVKLAWKKIKLAAGANLSAHRKEVIREQMLKTNTHFKRRHLQMLEVEHKYNIEIAKLKIKKLNYEIELLEDERH